jgi:hypothetical protein
MLIWTIAQYLILRNLIEWSHYGWRKLSNTSISSSRGQVLWAWVSMCWIREHVRWGARNRRLLLFCIYNAQAPRYFERDMNHSCRLSNVNSASWVYLDIRSFRAHERAQVRIFLRIASEHVLLRDYSMEGKGSVGGRTAEASYLKERTQQYTYPIPTKAASFHFPSLSFTLSRPTVQQHLSSRFL